MCPSSFPGPEEPFRMPEESSPRRTPQSVPYQDLPHLVNADGQYLFCRYWKPSGTPRYVSPRCYPDVPWGGSCPLCPFVCSSRAATFSMTNFTCHFNIRHSGLTELRFIYLFLKLRSRRSIFIITTRIRIPPYGSFQKFHMTLFFVLELISCCTGIPLKSNPAGIENHLIR